MDGQRVAIFSLRTEILYQPTYSARKAITEELLIMDGN
jgi:hypothetical protein